MLKPPGGDPKIMWKRILALVILGFLLFVSRATSYYKAPDLEPVPESIILVPEPMTEAELLDLAGHYADQYAVSRETVIRKTHCEAPIVVIDGVRYYDQADPQSRLTYSADQIRRHPNWGTVGAREDSWGPAQIHLPDNPSVSREQASDPDFALNFMAKAISEGKAGKWSCK